jgi:hypothetical protein
MYQKRRGGDEVKHCDVKLNKHLSHKHFLYDLDLQASNIEIYTAAPHVMIRRTQKISFFWWRCSKGRGVTHISGMTSLNIDSAFCFGVAWNTASHSECEVEWSRHKRRHESHLTDSVRPYRKFLLKQTAQIKTQYRQLTDKTVTQSNICTRQQVYSLYSHKETSFILYSCLGFCKKKKKKRK